MKAGRYKKEKMFLPILHQLFWAVVLNVDVNIRSWLGLFAFNVGVQAYETLTGCFMEF